jgi:hypothetical protein
VQLVSSGPEQNVHSWRQLEHELAIALRRTRATPNPYGLSLVLFGVLTAAAITFFVAREPAAVVQALNEMLRR